MIDLYYWTTPNGHKLTMFLEETGLPYALKPVNISRGEQFEPEFLAIAPNNRIPAIVDHAPAIDGGPLAMFESGAILLYLADKTGRLIPARSRARAGSASSGCSGRWRASGPMAGQNHHFGHYAIGADPYAIDRYVNETGRLYAVLDRAAAPAASSSSTTTRSPTSRAIRGFNPSGSGRTSTTFPDLKRWREAIAARPATQRAYAIAKTINVKPAMSDEESRKILFGQGRHTVR